MPVRRLTLFLLALGLALAACSARHAEPTAADGPHRRGLFTYLTDAALFEDCATRTRYPVAMEAAYRTLERTYVSVRRYPGQPVLVVVRGDVEPRPAMEGDRMVPTLVVRELLGVYPGETCGNPGATAPLENMYWKFTRLDGEPVTPVDGRREPHLVLHAGDGRLAGSGGCSRLDGDYELAGDTLRFEDVSVSRMNCREGMAQEARILAALRAVRTWRQDGVHLELLDADGAVLARLEATPMS